MGNVFILSVRCQRFVLEIKIGLSVLGHQTIIHFRNVFRLMDVSSAKPSDQPFHSPASFNVISIAGYPLCIH